MYSFDLNSNSRFLDVNCQKKRHHYTPNRDVSHVSKIDSVTTSKDTIACWLKFSYHAEFYKEVWDLS